MSFKLRKGSHEKEVRERVAVEIISTNNRLK